MMDTKLRDRIRALVEEISGGPVACESGYFEKGILDSMGAMALIEKMEAAFAIRLEAEDFNQFHFDSLDALEALATKRGAR
jgi:acyl carrier protein